MVFRIVQEYQLARYGSILCEPPEGPPIDDTPIPDNFSMVYSIMSTSSRTSTEGDLESVPSGSHGHDPSLLDSEEVSPASASSRKGGCYRLRVVEHSLIVLPRKMGGQVPFPTSNHASRWGLEVARVLQQALIRSARQMHKISPTSYYIHYFVSSLTFFVTIPYSCIFHSNVVLKAGRNHIVNSLENPAVPPRLKRKCRL